MSDQGMKPLNWQAGPDIGYRVSRREDGGMNLVFTNVTQKTLEHWREFAIAHLMDSDRLTRNLYDLRQVVELPKEAVTYAIEASNDPSMRNIRLAVVVSSEAVRQTVVEIAALTTAPGGVDIAIFTDIEQAESWLNHPLTFVV